jgi:hypothetical protein
MLSNLLPGLREIRAPLAAGYLFLVSAWVLFHDHVNVGEGASGTVDAILELKGQLGTGAFAAALSFLAFLLGALWEPAANGLQRGLWRLRPWYRALRHERSMHWRMAWDRALGHVEDQPPPTFHVSKDGWQQLRNVAGRLFADVNEQVRRRLRVPEISDSPLNLYFLCKRAEEISRVVERRETLGDDATIVGPEDEWFRNERFQYLPQTAEAGTIRIDVSKLAGYYGGDANSDVEQVADLAMAELESESVKSERIEWWIRELSFPRRATRRPSGTGIDRVASPRTATHACSLCRAPTHPT